MIIPIYSYVNENFLDKDVFPDTIIVKSEKIFHLDKYPIELVLKSSVLREV